MRYKRVSNPANLLSNPTLNLRKCVNQRVNHSKITLKIYTYLQSRQSL